MNASADFLQHLTEGERTHCLEYAARMQNTANAHNSAEKQECLS